MQDRHAAAPPDAPTAEQPPAVQLAVNAHGHLNLAMQQNAIPLIRQIRIENGLPRALRDVRIRVDVDSAFCTSWELHIELVREASVHQVNAIDLAFSSSYLAELTQRSQSALAVSLREGTELLAEQVVPIEVLAANEWSGLRSLPETLAAFVMPKHPAVQELLYEASELLAVAGHDASLSGYEAESRRRIVQMVAAAYGALVARELACDKSPPGFARAGQAIRAPDEILATQQASCLDLAVLLAGCLEQMGLHPLLILLREHALVGVWLDQQSFSLPVVDNGVLLRERIEQEEILVCDPIGVTATPAANLAQAQHHADERLRRLADFAALIDVRRARTRQIEPLSPRAEGGRRGAAEAVESPPVVEDSADRAAVAESQPDTETSQTKIHHWAERLRNLSMCNRLLAFRPSAGTVPLLCSDLAMLERQLVDGAALTLHARPPGLAAIDFDDVEALRRKSGDEIVERMLQRALASQRLYTDLGEVELGKQLLALHRDERTQLEESASSDLYLSLGVLSWYETPESEDRRLAPLLLLPLSLARGTAHEPFRIRAQADAPYMNAALLELLRRDFDLDLGELDALLEVATGLDIPLLLQRFRDAIRYQPDWKILDIAQIGSFPFAAFQLWRDLAERWDTLRETPLVRRLAGPGSAVLEGAKPLPAPARLDERRLPDSVFCPLPIDSSQLAAVLAATQGESFVLEGPPGTGKSQTIANLISHWVGRGKTVLFVAEKATALDVVRRRLQSAGLGAATLELYSPKAVKEVVYDQLGETHCERGGTARDLRAQVARKLDALRRDLNGCADALHGRRVCGYSVFTATSQLIGHRNAPPVALGWEAPDAIDSDQLQELRTAVAQLGTAGAALEGLRDHPWRAVRNPEPPEAQVTERIRRLAEALGEFVEAVEGAGEVLGVPRRPLSAGQLRALDELCQAMLTPPGAPTALVCEDGWQEIRTEIDSWVHLGRARDELRQQILALWTPELLDGNVRSTAVAWKRAAVSWWPASSLRAGAVARSLRRFSKEDHKPESSDIQALLVSAAKLRELEKQLRGVAPRAVELLGSERWNNGNPDWEDVVRVTEWADQLRRISARIAGEDVVRGADLREQWARLAARGSAQLAPHGEHGRPLVRYRAGMQTLEVARATLEGLLDIDAKIAWGTVDSPEAVRTWRHTVGVWTRQQHRLGAWCRWLREKRRAIGLNLSPLVEGYEAGEIASDELPGAFEHSFFLWWRSAVLSAEPALARFVSAEHERKIAAFRETDEHYIELTRRVLADLVAERASRHAKSDIPDVELGVLRRESKRECPRLALRQLFEKIPRLLSRLKPCLLMSPTAAAQHLPTDHPSFDLVIFDEASQIPVGNALGALARGKQAVVVGDPKQLPPPASPRSEAGGDGEEDRPAPPESLLDACLATGMPVLRLDWHYRSRHESLISFGNDRVYDGRLRTFPAAGSEATGISLHYVADGVYEHGASRTNRREAEDLVAEIARRARDAELRDLSIGVIACTGEQRELIEDLLERKRQRDGEFASFLAQHAEPLFVKNLEHVQGDERDLILLSVTYGPDAAGHLPTHFGSLSHVGGERLLHVAATRARREIAVFASVLGEQIDLFPGQAQGVKELKHYLEYTERGGSGGTWAERIGKGADAVSPFEKEVHDAIAAAGWPLHRQVGCSSYRIDLAVLDPETPGRYLLGIQCDDANYHRREIARDRDKLSEATLRDLGWELHRIWSIDWWNDPARETKRVLAAIESRSPPSRRAAVAETPAAAPEGAQADTEWEPQPAPPREAPPAAPPDRKRPAKRPVRSEPQPAPLREASPAAPPDRKRPAKREPKRTVRSGPQPAPPREAPRATSSEPKRPARRAPKRAARPKPERNLARRSAPPPTAESAVADAAITPRAVAAPTPPAPGGGVVLRGTPQVAPYAATPVQPRGDQDAFRAESTGPAIREVLETVVATEAPILLDLAARRVAAHWGLTRVNDQAAAWIDQLISASEVQKDLRDGEVVLWPSSSRPDAWWEVRGPGEEAEDQRAITDVPLCEVANALHVALAGGEAMPRAELMRAAMRPLGFQRMGRRVQKRVNQAIERELAAGRLREDARGLIARQGGAPAAGEPPPARRAPR